ncbi:MAG: class I SAM-dependent methyltransferase [Burkholderiales bacterium]
MALPVSLQRRARRFACTFLPFLVRRQSGAGTREHWEKHPTVSAFEGIDPASQAQMDEIMALAPERDAAILDLGCNVGRHLAYLHAHGYRNLRGVDWSESAIRDMAQRYPDMHAHAKLTRASFQDFLSAAVEPMDLVYTRGATFELVHPSFPLIRHVCRIAKRHAVLVISEAGHAYPRFWEYEFAREGFELTHLKRPASPVAPDHRVSLMTFTRLNHA